MSTLAFYKDVGTFVLAALGTSLGVFNTYTAHKQKQVRLEVKARYSHIVQAGRFGPTMASIEVINLSSFPVYLSEIGFQIIGRSERLAVLEPLTSDRQPIARKLESRQSVTGYCEVPQSSRGVAGACYATLSTGERFLGNMLGKE